MFTFAFQCIKKINKCTKYIRNSSSSSSFSIQDPFLLQSQLQSDEQAIQDIHIISILYVLLSSNIVGPNK